MSTIFAKLRLAALSNLHTLLDKTIDLNSVGAVEQHLRDFKKEREGIDNAVAKAIATIKGYNDEKNTRAARVVELDKIIRRVLGNTDPNDDHIAKPKAEEMVNHNKAIAALEKKIEEATGTRAQLEQALSIIDSHIGELESRLEALRSTEVDARSKEEADALLKNVSKLLDRNTSGNVDNALKRAEDRSRTASVSLDRTMGRIKSGGTQSETSLAADDLLAQYRTEVKAPSTATAAD